MQPHQLQPHVDPERRVEVGERLVEEEYLGLPHDGAADGDALALAARELLRPPLEQVRELQHVGGRLHLLLPIPGGEPAIFSAKPMFSATVMCG